ncbi:MAG: Crp/Fnr family transcriptional regulator [Chitinophagales bacterium]
MAGVFLPPAIEPLGIFDRNEEALPDSVVGGEQTPTTAAKAATIFSSLILAYCQSILQLDQLINYIKNYSQLSTEAQHVLHDCFEQVVLSKNEYLLMEGKICRHLYFIQNGALRGFYNLDGKEITHWFAFENDFVTSLHSFITQKPAVENIQSQEGCILWAISKETLSSLFDQYHEIERLVRIVYEKYYIRLEERFVNAQFKTATERYENLIHQTPHILERIPLGHIASYLGVSQETLSRIRSRL